MKRTELRLTSLLLAGMLLFSAAAAEAAELKLPSSLSVIGEEAFFGDSSLASVTVAEGTESIEARAFAYSGLTFISLPASLSYIAEDAFEGVLGLSASAPLNSFAYRWCVVHGLIKPALGFSHAGLSGGVLDLPQDTRAFAVIPLEITAPGSWTLSLSSIAPSPASWITADRLSGTGNARVSLTVRAVPVKTNYNIAEIFACRLTLTGGGKTASVLVTLSKEGPFINRHVNTGDPVEDIIAVAQSQVGYRGGANAGDLDGDPAGDYDRNYTKYTKFMGYGATAWCAAFVSWCAWQAGQRGRVKGSVTASPGAMVGTNVSVTYFNQLNATQRKNHPYLEKYGTFLDRSLCRPKRGDFIYFRWADAAYSTTFSHVGIVLSCSEDTITFIDGNRGDTDRVQMQTIDRTSPDIAAYFTPW